MAQPNNLLIDVRSPLEFSTGALSNDLYATTTNIEFTSIASLPDVYAALGTQVSKADNITLYCRSGRRSNIALHTLRELGYENVRDIGGFEEARLVLAKEQMERAKAVDGGLHANKKVDNKEKVEQRKKAFGALLEGLKGCGED